MEEWRDGRTGMVFFRLVGWLCVRAFILLIVSFVLTYNVEFELTSGLVRFSSVRVRGGGFRKYKVPTDRETFIGWVRAGLANKRTEG